jgi:hypothetical protein
MTDNKKIFCEGVERLCNIAGCPELYAPIVQIASLCEAEGNPEDNTTIAQVDLNKVPQEELDSLQAEFAQASDAKKAVETADQELETAKEAQNEINANLANKLNATAAEAEKDAGAVNSEEATA